MTSKLGRIEYPDEMEIALSYDILCRIVAQYVFSTVNHAELCGIENIVVDEFGQVTVALGVAEITEE